MAQSKKATPVAVKQNNNVLITPPTPVELNVVGDHLEYDPKGVNAGVIVKPV